MKKKEKKNKNQTYAIHVNNCFLNLTILKKKVLIFLKQKQTNKKGQESLS